MSFLSSVLDSSLPFTTENISETETLQTAVVKVADDVRGHKKKACTDSLIHKDHVDVVTVALIHFVALIHG